MPGARRNVVLLFPLVVAVALTASCAAQTAHAHAPASATPPLAAADASPLASTSTATSRATPTPAPTPPPLFGIALPVPPHGADATAADRRALDTALPALGGAIGGSFLYTPQGGIPAAATAAVAHARQLGLEPVISIGFDAATGGRYTPTVDFTLPGEVGAYTEALAAFARATHPRYLGIGDDLNGLWAEQHLAYDAFASVAPVIVAAIHAASPRTRVFATFQYESLAGAPAGGAPATSHWVLMEQLAPALDLVAFTSLPHRAYATPAAIPTDYYAQAVTHAGGRPVAFTAVGWPAAPAPGGTPALQAKFIDRLPALMHGVSPRILLWPEAYDDPAAAPPGAALGLAGSDGSPRPALDAWKRLVSTP